ncbi:MAG: ISLre2 family transposase, partial [Isosphaeraceae bacterium]
MTAAGRVVAARRSMRCRGCGLTAYPADDRIGLDGFLSPGGTRLACLAAASWSFDVASDRLDALAGVRIDGETIRRHV